MHIFRGGALCTNLENKTLLCLIIEKPCVESFIVYDIQKGNTDNEINFYTGINDEKGKSHEDYVELRILYFI
jgi:hypothetical protein